MTRGLRIESDELQITLRQYLALTRSSQANKLARLTLYVPYPIHNFHKSLDETPVGPTNRVLGWR